MKKAHSRFTRKPIVASLLLMLAACGSAAQASDLTMFRSPSCGCCLKWLEHVRSYFAGSDQVRFG